MKLCLTTSGGHKSNFKYIGCSWTPRYQNDEHLGPSGISRCAITLALLSSSGNMTLFPCFLVDGQCPHPRGKQVGWQDRRPQAGRRRHSQVLSSTPAGDLPARPHPVANNDSPVTPASPGLLCPPVPCLCPTLVPVG